MSLLVDKVVDSELTVGIRAARTALRQWLLYRDDTLLRQRPGWTQEQCAEHCNTTPSGWRSYVARYDVIAKMGHDFHTGAALWDEHIVRMWQCVRPGQGARTDLQATP